MKSPASSDKQAEIDIQDYYAIKVASIWNGLKQESPAFWFLCIYLFFEYVRPQAIYTGIDFFPWAQTAFILAFVTVWSDPTIKWVRSPENFLIILFLLVVVLSSAFAFKPDASWDNLDIMVIWVVLYFLIINIVNSEKRLLVFMLLFLLVNFKMSQFGAISFANRGFSFAKWGVSGSPGWFENAGDFCMQMTIFVPLSIAFVLALKHHWGKYKKLFFYLMPLTGLITIVASSSRGGQLGLVGVALWYILKSRQRIKGIVSILLVGAMLYAILPDKMLEEYQTSGTDRTSVQRLNYWKYGLTVIEKNPGLGVGYENWMYNCWYEYPFRSVEGMFCLEPHNTFIEAGAELGVTGLLVYLLMTLYMFIINGRTRRNAGKTNNQFIYFTASALDGGVIGYMISSFFLTVLFYPIFWVQVAMTVALHEISKQQENSIGEEVKSGDVTGNRRREAVPTMRH